MQVDIACSEFVTNNTKSTPPRSVCVAQDSVQRCRPPPMMSGFPDILLNGGVLYCSCPKLFKMKCKTMACFRTMGLRLQRHVRTRAHLFAAFMIIQDIPET